jgi:N-acetylglutamate synthase-like GNAT family acetyltransferase
MSLEAMTPASKDAVHVRQMLAADLDAADEVMRLAFGTVGGLLDPAAAFGDRDLVRTRFAANPESAWVVEADSDVVGSVFAARWGSFAFFGPLTVHPGSWDRGIGSRLLGPVLDAFRRWEVRQAGLFTFAASTKHLGLYQKHGFWPGRLTLVTAKTPDTRARGAYTVVSAGPEARSGRALDEIRDVTDRVFPGLDVGAEIEAVAAQRIGDTVLTHGEEQLEGVAVCHCGAGSEAGSGTCYVKVGAVRPGEGAAGRFERLLDACEDFAAESGLGRLELGINTGRLDAYRHVLARGFGIEQIGLSMLLLPEGPHFDKPEHHVIADLR